MDAAARVALLLARRAACAYLLRRLRRAAAGGLGCSKQLPPAAGFRAGMQVLIAWLLLR